MKPSKPIRICITHDEEIGCLSAAPVAEFLREAGITPELMVIGEPTSMRVVNAHKGILSYETVVTGLEAHSSATHRGVNAVMVAAELVHLLSKEAERAREQGVQDARFDPPYTTVHVGVLEGGVARNIIPASCRMAWEIRPVPGDTPQDILARFESHALALQAEMRTRYAGASIVIRQLTNVAPLKPHDEGGEQLVKRLLGTNEAHAVSFGTEAGIFQSYGLPAIVCGPGSIDQAHKPDEYIEISQISACLRFLEQLTASLSS